MSRSEVSIIRQEFEEEVEEEEHVFHFRSNRTFCLKRHPDTVVTDRLTGSSQAQVVQSTYGHITALGIMRMCAVDLNHILAVV